MWYLIGFATAAAVFFGVCLIVNAELFKSRVNGRSDELDGQKVKFKSGKNTLEGRIWNNEGKKGIVVVSHGMGVDVKYYLPEIAAFAENGFKVFAYEYTGYGDSQGRFSGFFEAAKDLKSAIDFVYDQNLPLILWGHSMGAYASAAVGQLTDKKISAIVCAAAFSSPKDAVKQLASADKKTGKMMQAAVFVSQLLLFGKNRNLQAADGIKKAKAPTLLLQGDSDDEVPPSGCSLYARRTDLPPYAKTILVSSAGSNGHMTVVRRRGEKCVNAETMAYVLDFLKEVL